MQSWVNDYLQAARKEAKDRFVRLKRGYYKDFYAIVSDVSCNGDYFNYHIVICRKDRTGTIINDRGDARRYYRLSELDFDIDKTMLKKLEEAYPVDS